MSLPINKKRGGRVLSVLGRMNQKLSLYAVTVTTDSQGGGTEAGSLVRSVWGAVEPITGNKRLEYAQEVNGKPYKVYISTVSDLTITESHYIVWGSKTLYIHSVVDYDEDNRFLEITAWEKA